jgi:hypothetical protein
MNGRGIVSGMCGILPLLPDSFLPLLPPQMRIQTPYNFSRFAYFGLDTSARSGDEFLGCGLGRLYFGIYPNQYGFEISYGILNEKDCLN